MEAAVVGEVGGGEPGEVFVWGGHLDGGAGSEVLFVGDAGDVAERLLAQAGLNLFISDWARISW
jgi:hypothetical protein